MPKMKTSRAAAKRFKLTGTGKLKRNKAYKSQMLNTMMKSEMTHIIEFDNLQNGDIVRLEYQHTYNRNTKEFNTTTTEQRPDIVVTIRKPDGFFQYPPYVPSGSLQGGPPSQPSCPDSVSWHSLP